MQVLSKCCSYSLHPFIQLFGFFQFLTSSYSNDVFEKSFFLFEAGDKKAEIFGSCLFDSIIRLWQQTQQWCCLLLRQSLISYSQAPAASFIELLLCVNVQ